MAGAVVLVALYGFAAMASFLAPYAQDTMDRERFYQPPQPLHWRKPDGGLRLLPFVHPMRLVDGAGFRYVEDRSRVVPLRWFVAGEPYRWLGFLPSRLHLFGAAGTDRVYVLGTDGFGRDVLSRLLFGAQVSLTVGLVGIAISFTLGLLLGGVSGYFGGWVDATIMRCTELLLSVPSLYLILALRTLFPDHLPSQGIYLAIVAILAFIGWATLARAVRGLVLSIRAQDYVAAAEALGMSRTRVLVRHILPNTTSFVVVAATLAVPGYILGEVVLSFLGVGVQEPAASWGNMLTQARLRSLTSFPWLIAAPGVAIFVTVMAFHLLGDGLRDALDPHRVEGGRAS
jgi:peptide/nickel transport system permease protein